MLKISLIMSCALFLLLGMFFILKDKASILINGYIKTNVKQQPCKDMEAGYTTREFKDDEKFYKLYFKEIKGHYIMFKTTYKKEQEKNIRTHYITTIKIDE